MEGHVDRGAGGKAGSGSLRRQHYVQVQAVVKVYQWS